MIDISNVKMTFLIVRITLVFNTASVCTRDESMCGEFFAQSFSRYFMCKNHENGFGSFFHVAQLLWLCLAQSMKNIWTV